MFGVDIWHKMNHLPEKILKIGLRISKVSPKIDIWKESTLWHGKFILWQKVGEKLSFDGI